MMAAYNDESWSENAKANTNANANASASANASANAKCKQRYHGRFSEMDDDGQQEEKKEQRQQAKVAISFAKIDIQLLSSKPFLRQRGGRGAAA